MTKTIEQLAVEHGVLARHSKALEKIPALLESRAKRLIELEAMCKAYHAQAQRQSESAWVVVTYDNSVIKYRTMDSAGIDWTLDHNEAIRFSRRADAEMFAAGDEFSDLRIEQHMWSVAPTKGE